MLAILAWSSIQCVHNSVSQIYSLSDCALNHVQIGCQPGEHISVLYSRMWSNINPNCNPNRMHDEKFEQIGCYASMDIISLMKYRCNGRHSCYVGDQSSFPSTGCTSKEICIKIIYQCNSKAICSTKLAECSEFPENQKKCVKRLAQWGCACPSNFCPEQNIDEQMRLCGFNHECYSPIGPLFWNGKKRLVLSEETANFVCALMEKSCKESVDCCVFANNMYGCRFKCMKITAFARKPLCKSTSIFGFPILESYQKGQLNMSCSNDSQSAMRMICTLDNGWIPLNISDFLNCGCNQEIYEFLEAFKTLFIQHSDLDFQMFRNLAVLPSWNLQTALLSAFEMSKWTSIKFDQTFIHGKTLIRIYEVMDMHTINLESNLFRTGNPDINTDLKLSPRFTGNTRSVETLLLLVKSEDDFRHITIWFKASSSEKDIKFQLSINLMFSKQSDLNSCDRSFIKINSKYPSCSQWNDNVSDQIKYFSHCEIVTEVINSNKSIEVFIMNDVPYNVQLTSKAVSTSTINITSETATENEATTIDLQTTANTSIECSTSSIKQVKASNSVVNCSNSKLLSNCSEIDIRVADDWLSTLENKMKEEMSASLRKKVIYLLHEGEIQFGVLKNKMKYAHFKANVSKHKMSKDTVKIFTASNLKQGKIIF
ncbi:hypothetical protein GJ496_009974 [Pomphorhynchus laevis]|nr:hypothetical protein GJ496_009974 [Pomphorhynchus laevis]